MSNGIIQYSNNQCLDFFQSRRLEYDSLNYRSEAEIAIAKAIDKHNREVKLSSEACIFFKTVLTSREDVFNNYLQHF